MDMQRSLRSQLSLMWLGQFGRQALTRVSDLAMPPVCLSCQVRLVDHHALCPACWSTIEFIRPPLCDRLGVPLPFGVGERVVSAAAAANPPPYDRARAVGVYSGRLKTLVHDFKFRDRQDLRRLFVRLMLEVGTPFWADTDVIIPVPLHRARLLKRRFNQAALLAKAVSQQTGVPFAPRLLQRTRATAQQVGLTRLQRKDNVRGAFSVPAASAGELQNAHVVLIDDVITTGATASACARALRQAGARQVDVLALALAVPGRDDGLMSGLLTDQET